MDIDKIVAEVKALSDTTDEITHNARAVHGEAFAKVLDHARVASCIIETVSMLTNNPIVRDIVVNATGRMIADYSEAMKITDDQFVEAVRLMEVLASKRMQAEERIAKGAL